MSTKKPGLGLIRDEAVAYLKLGLMSPGKKRVRSSSQAAAPFGVMFVPGVGANGSQFLALKTALTDQTQWFDAFEYNWFSDPRRLADRLGEHVARASRRCGRIVLVGHSLGGVVCRLLLQSDEPPEAIVGFVSICAPLHGTWRSRIAPSPGLRTLIPDSALMQDVLRTSHRLERLKGAIVTIGARHDQFVDPHTSAFLDGHPNLELSDVAHAGSLFDPRVHSAVRELVERLKSASPPA